MPRQTIVPLPVLLGFAVSLAIVALAHAEPAEGATEGTVAPQAPVEQQTTSKSGGEDEPSGWLGGFKALFSWRVGDILDSIEVEPANSEREDRRDR